MSERYFLEATVCDQRATLTGDEARHLARVMRSAPGDEVTLFDGSGAEFLARIAAVSKSAVELEIVERRAIDRELPLPVTLAVALPKGDRQKWLVEKATELGVTELVPLVTGRGVAQPVDAALARLRRAVIEASKQCGRNRLMAIGEPTKAEAFFSNRVRGPSGQEPDGVLRLIADPPGEPLSALADRRGPITAAIGPEGGFSPVELAAAINHGWQPVSLGKSILRIETAAVAIASWAALR